MATHTGTIARRRTGWLGGRLGRALVGLLGLIVAGSAGAPIAYMLWPRPAAIAPDAPSMPVTVGGVVFNVPPAAIRVAMQRRTGPQSRIDMTFLWPSLDPPNPAIRPSPTAVPNVTDRLFITIAGSDGTLAPVERLKAIYPRYVAGGAEVGPDGLAVQGFRTGSPYHGEDLVHDPAAPERFLLRCTRTAGTIPDMCLHERRIAGADVTVRFPRQWLADWRTVANAIDRLIASLRPTPG
jgi:hypothetical protein